MGPRSVLFLCQGNRCRSPFAAGLFARTTAGWPPPAPTVRSAGFTAPNHTPPAEAIVVADRAGVDLRSHRSSLLTTETVRTSDLVVVMSPEQASGIRRRFGGSLPSVVVLGDLDPSPESARAIPDPLGYPLSAYEESYERITRCVIELARLLEPRDARPPASRATAWQ
jgi:protein-tyrosine phosphatase